MGSTEIREHITTNFGDRLISDSESFDIVALEIAPENLIPLLIWLRDDEALHCNFLTDLCGIHYPEQPNRELGVIYMVHSWTKNIRIRIKCFVPLSNPEVPSIVSLYAAANWMERETFDFYGIRFAGHPDLRRILNVDEMDYHPLRKEYALEDGTRTDKDDRYFGREGNTNRQFDQRYIK